MANIDNLLERYSPAQVAQCLTHRSTEIYGESYVGHVPRVDTVNALAGKEADFTHAEYFGSFRQYHEHGLPHNLPAEYQKQILLDPKVIELTTEIEKARAIGDESEAKRLQNRQGNAKRKVFSEKLARFKSEWVQKQWDWKVQTRGKLRPELMERTAVKQAQSKIMPELGRLAATMSSEEPLTFEEKLIVTDDLYTQCIRDFEVIYHPGEEPVNRRCPASACDEIIEK